MSINRNLEKEYKNVYEQINVFVLILKDLYIS